MGALYFLSHDDCMVHWCASPDKVTVRYHRGQGEGVFEVVGFAEGKQKTLFGGLVKERVLVV
jgi:hypothetical protein